MTRLRSFVRPALLSLAAVCLSACGDTGQDYANSSLQAMERGKANGARGDMQAIAMALTNYLTAEGELPAVDDIHSLAEKLEPGYIRMVKRQDPWGNDYAFSCDGTDYTIRSAGVGGGFDDGDDVVMESGQIIKMPDGFETKL